MHLLRTARCFGDVLFVGVNSDASVRRLKGPGRPLNCLRSRLMVLTELRSVDWAVPFDEDTPLELVRAILPDVLVKGGDYTAEAVVGGDLVRSAGGRVEIVPLLQGFSSTGLMESMDDTWRRSP